MTDLERLDDAFRLGLGLPPDADPADAAYGRTEGWDSVGHMELVVAIESAFGISMDADEVFEMTDYASVLRLLHDRHAIGMEARP